MHSKICSNKLIEAFEDMTYLRVERGDNVIREGIARYSREPFE